MMPSEAGPAPERIERWFRTNARPLPWRVPSRDPWWALLSELLAQQTQVSRAAEKFELILGRFPTPTALADAADAGRADDLLSLWQGLGYYRRAHLLIGAARAIRDEHGGVTPIEAAALRALPGVGRYTAGAVASIAGGRREAIVDGNVARVLLRVRAPDHVPHHAGDRQTDRWLWAESAALVARAGDPGVFNEGLMELGATVCTPKRARCVDCPVRDGCAAHAAGRVDEIPAPKPRKERSTMRAAAIVVRDADDRVLLERRPSGGLWGGLWQAPTDDSGSRTSLAARLGVTRSFPAGEFVFLTTHRRVTFEVHTATAAGDGGRWVTPSEASELVAGRAQRLVLEAGGVPLGGEQ